MNNTAKKATDNYKPKPSEYLLEEEKLSLSRDSNLYGGVYKELAELLGDAATTKIWKRFKGVTVTFPITDIELIREEIWLNKLIHPCDKIKPINKTQANSCVCLEAETPIAIAVRIARIDHIGGFNDSRQIVVSDRDY